IYAYSVVGSLDISSNSTITKEWHDKHIVRPDLVNDCLVSSGGSFTAKVVGYVRYFHYLAFNCFLKLSNFSPSKSFIVVFWTLPEAKNTLMLSPEMTISLMAFISLLSFLIQTGTCSIWG